MVKNGKQKGVGNGERNPEAEERKRLMKLAISSKLLLSSEPSLPKHCSVALNPSKTVLKHHGKDIIRKSNRKNRFLFSFPGLLAPVTGGKIGELKDLGSKNPVLYLDFPQGQMKLFGTIVYPKNRYLTLQFSRGGKNVICEDCFDTLGVLRGGFGFQVFGGGLVVHFNVYSLDPTKGKKRKIVFSEAWWIGTKDENPEEVRLEFPENLRMEQQPDYDFKGGAGSTSERIWNIDGSGTKPVKQPSPKRELDNEFTDSENDLKDLIQVTPTRHSSRTARKTYKFAEISSEDNSAEIKAEPSEEEDREVGPNTPTGSQPSGKTQRTLPVVFDIDNKYASNNASEQLQHYPVSVTKSNGPSSSGHGSLIQATISTLFKKVEEKKAPRKLTHSSASKVSNKSLLEAELEDKTDQAKKGPSKKGKAVKQSKIGTKSAARRKKAEVEDDDIEEFSSTSQDTDGSDEEWEA